VAQLGEQQVQGCTTRIAHLETDLVHRVDSLRQQQDTQAASMSGLTAHLARLQAQVKDGDKSSSVAQIAARLAELNGAVLELQNVSAGGSAKEADSELKSDVDALRGQVSQLRASQAEQQSAGSSLASIEHDIAVLRNELTQLQSSQAAQRPADPALSKLEQDLAALNAELSQTWKDHASHFSVTSSAIDQKIEFIRLELSQLHDQPAAQSSAHKLYSHLQQDVVALQGQLSQLDKTQGSQLAHEQWQEETQCAIYSLCKRSIVFCTASRWVSAHAQQLNKSLQGVYTHEWAASTTAWKACLVIMSFKLLLLQRKQVLEYVCCQQGIRCNCVAGVVLPET